MHAVCVCLDGGGRDCSHQRAREGGATADGKPSQIRPLSHRARGHMAVLQESRRWEGCANLYIKIFVFPPSTQGFLVLARMHPCMTISRMLSQGHNHKLLGNQYNYIHRLCIPNCKPLYNGN